MLHFEAEWNVALKLSVEWKRVVAAVASPLYILSLEADARLSNVPSLDETDPLVPLHHLVSQ